MTNDVLQNLYKKKNIILAHHIPRWNELPSIELYMDQLITVISDVLQPFTSDMTKMINKSIINNYVKLGFIPAPKNKRYSKEHIAYLMFVCCLKQTLPIGYISAMIRELTADAPVSVVYDNFCDELEAIVANAMKNAENRIGDLECPQTAKTALTTALTARANNLIAIAVTEQFTIDSKEKKEKSKKNKPPENSK